MSNFHQKLIQLAKEDKSSEVVKQLHDLLKRLEHQHFDYPETILPNVPDISNESPFGKDYYLSIDEDPTIKRFYYPPKLTKYVENSSESHKVAFCRLCVVVLRKGNAPGSWQHGGFWYVEKKEADAFLDETIEADRELDSLGKDKFTKIFDETYKIERRARKKKAETTETEEERKPEEDEPKVKREVSDGFSGIVAPEVKLSAGEETDPQGKESATPPGVHLDSSTTKGAEQQLEEEGRSAEEDLIQQAEEAFKDIKPIYFAPDKAISVQLDQHLGLQQELVGHIKLIQFKSAERSVVIGVNSFKRQGITWNESNSFFKWEIHLSVSENAHPQEGFLSGLLDLPDETPRHFKIEFNSQASSAPPKKEDPEKPPKIGKYVVNKTPPSWWENLPEKAKAATAIPGEFEKYSWNIYQENLPGIPQSARDEKVLSFWYLRLLAKGTGKLKNAEWKDPEYWEEAAENNGILFIKESGDLRLTSDFKGVSALLYFKISKPDDFEADQEEKHLCLNLNVAGPREPDWVKKFETTEPPPIKNANEGKEYESENLNEHLSELPEEARGYLKLLSFSKDGAPAVEKEVDKVFGELLGLEFNPGKGLITGTPKSDGEYKLTFAYSSPVDKEPSKPDGIGEIIKGAVGKLIPAITERNVDRVVKALPVRLYINPDPFKMWAVEKDPPEDLPYSKEHRTNEYRISKEDLVMGSASVRGRSHAMKGTYRDDDCSMGKLVGGWNFLCVADGAGSSKHSRKGSLIAVTEMKQYLRDILIESDNSLNSMNADSEILAKGGSLKTENWRVLIKAAQSSLNKIAKEAKDHGNGAKTKDYSTTLICCLFKDVGEKRVFVSFCIGDGAIGVISNKGDKPKLLSIPDSGEFAGETVFLTSTKVLKTKQTWDRIRATVVDKPCALFAMSDGVSDALLPTDKDLKDPAKWETMLCEADPGGGYHPNENSEGKTCPPLIEIMKMAKENKGSFPELERWLYFWSKGNHDDRTIVFAADNAFPDQYNGNS